MLCSSPSRTFHGLKPLIRAELSSVSEKFIQFLKSSSFFGRSPMLGTKRTPNTKTLLLLAVWGESLIAFPLCRKLHFEQITDYRWVYSLSFFFYRSPFFRVTVFLRLPLSFKGVVVIQINKGPSFSSLLYKRNELQLRILFFFFSFLNF